MGFTKKDIRSGDVVELRRGDRYVVLLDDSRANPFRGIGISDRRGWADFCIWNDDMTHPDYSRLDVVKVLRTKSPHIAPWNATDDEMDVVFDRTEITELTVAEVSELLGFKVKIIEG